MTTINQPVAWAAFAENGNIRIWTSAQEDIRKLAETVGVELVPLYTSPVVAAADGVPEGWREELPGVIAELKGGSNWLGGKHDVYSYSRSPKIAAAVLSALDGMSIAELVEELQDAHKWKREGFGHWKDVSAETNDAPFKAAAFIAQSLSASPSQKKAQRYEFLRDKWWFCGASDSTIRAALSEEELDAAIDEAMLSAAPASPKVHCYGPDNPPRLRKPGESVQEYRASMGWETEGGSA